MKEKKEPKPEPSPLPCPCGSPGVLVFARGRGKMVSCANPVKCTENYRTPWMKTKLQAIDYWNDVTIMNGGKF